MRLPRWIPIAFVVAAGCGGGGSGSPAPSPTTTTVTDSITGTTIQNPTGCSGDSHTVTTAAGEIAVRLVETSDPAQALSVQVCGGGIDDGNCSIKQQRITVGQRITGTRTGVASQTLKLLGHSCVFGGTPAAAPITYRAELTYQR